MEIEMVGGLGYCRTTASGDTSFEVRNLDVVENSKPSEIVVDSMNMEIVGHNNSKEMGLLLEPTFPMGSKDNDYAGVGPIVLAEEVEDAGLLQGSLGPVDGELLGAEKQIGKQTLGRAKVRRQRRKELREVLDGMSAMEIENSGLSVSDSGICRRNELYWEEANEAWKISKALGIQFVGSRREIVDTLARMDMEDREGS
ncbi:hypothetical protein REPUB_Repub07fG0200400 [Reevesia pubescens]